MPTAVFSFSICRESSTTSGSAGSSLLFLACAKKRPVHKMLWWSLLDTNQVEVWLAGKDSNLRSPDPEITDPNQARQLLSDLSPALDAI
jgi:hypothetical protein